MDFNSKIIKNSIDLVKKTSYTLCLCTFWVVIMIIAIEIILGNLIFYKYVYLPQKKPAEITEKLIKFNIEEFEKLKQKLEKNNITI